MYPVGLYTKNLIYTEKPGISSETQFGYMYCDRGKQVELSHTLYCKHSNQNMPPSTPQMLSHTKLSHFLEESAINYVDTQLEAGETRQKINTVLIELLKVAATSLTSTFISILLFCRCCTVTRLVKALATINNHHTHSMWKIKHTVYCLKIHLCIMSFLH